MKKKKLKKGSEKAFKVIKVLKENAEILHEKGNDTAFILELEASVQNLDELEKELITLKETLNAKKCVYKQEKELVLELVKNAEKVIKNEIGKKQKPEQKPQEKTNEIQVVEQQEEKEQKPVKLRKTEKKPKTETTDEKQNPEIDETADEPKL
jgi:hypothetical protein